MKFNSKKFWIFLTSKVSFKKLVISFVSIASLTILSYFLYSNSNLILSQIIARITQTPVTINYIDFHRDFFTIQHLTIGNPKKAYIPIAFKAETVKIKASYKQYLENSIIIDKIEMHDIYLNIEFYTEDKMEGNWQTLIENMEKSHKKKKKNKRKAIIKKLVLDNIQVNLILSNGKIHRLSPIKHIEFDDVNSEEGIPIKEISEIVAKKVIYSILKEEGLNLIIKIPLQVIKKFLPFL